MRRSAGAACGEATPSNTAIHLTRLRKLTTAFRAFSLSSLRPGDGERWAYLFERLPNKHSRARLDSKRRVVIEKKLDNDSV